MFLKLVYPEVIEFLVTNIDLGLEQQERLKKFSDTYVM